MGLLISQFDKTVRGLWKISQSFFNQIKQSRSPQSKRRFATLVEGPLIWRSDTYSSPQVMEGQIWEKFENLVLNFSKKIFSKG